jgi:hypothetical protein
MVRRNKVQKSKKLLRKEKGRRKFVGETVAINPAKFQLCFLEVRKYEYEILPVDEVQYSGVCST